MTKWPTAFKQQKTTFGGLDRSALMSKVKGKGNKSTEKRLSNMLRMGDLKGWRRHLPLPGKPDFSWPKLKIAVFVDGCFWHGHNCGKNISPKTNPEEWASKISRNKERDCQVKSQLVERGWIVVRIWECELKRDPSGSLMKIRHAIEMVGARKSSSLQPEIVKHCW